MSRSLQRILVPRMKKCHTAQAINIRLWSHTAHVGPARSDSLGISADSEAA